MNTNLLTVTLLALVGLTSAHAAAPLNDNIATGTRLTGNYQKITGQNLTLATAHVMDPMINGASDMRALIPHDRIKPDLHSLGPSVRPLRWCHGYVHRNDLWSAGDDAAGDFIQFLLAQPLLRQINHS